MKLPIFGYSQRSDWDEVMSKQPNIELVEIGGDELLQHGISC